jgi:hypothetical protein
MSTQARPARVLDEQARALYPGLLPILGVCLRVDGVMGYVACLT